MIDAKLHPVHIHNRSRSIERTAWMFGQPANSPDTAFIFLDGELYLERVRALDTIRRVEEAGSLSNYVALFLSSGGPMARHTDFVCSPEYASFVAEDVVSRIRQDYSSVGQFVLLGLSLSGLAAAHVATRYPSLFRRVICQSPSFWWERGRFAEELPPAPTPAPAFCICVGDQETGSGVAHPPSGLRQEMTQIAGCTAVVAAMCANGYQVRMHTYRGGHDPDCWREDLELALPWTSGA